MTTYVDFTPSTTAPFQFQATFDGALYTVIVTWNIFGERYFVSVYDLAGDLIVSEGLVSSAPKIGAALSWANGTATVIAAAAHNVPTGSLARVTVSDTDTTYDGTYQMLALNATTLSFLMPADPGITASGNIAQNVDLLGPYFDSTLVFRENTQQFEY